MSGGGRNFNKQNKSSDHTDYSSTLCSPDRIVVPLMSLAWITIIKHPRNSTQLLSFKTEIHWGFQLLALKKDALLFALCARPFRATAAATVLPPANGNPSRFRRRTTSL